MTDHWVYLVYEGDELLYIGYTGNVDRRLHQHQGHAWWPENATVHLHGPYTFEQALEEERFWIKRLDPKLNRTGVSRTLKSLMPTHYEVRDNTDHQALQAKRRRTMIQRGFWKSR